MFTNELDLITKQDEPVSVRKLPWVEKYRPTTTDKIISHHEIIMSLNKFMSLQTLPHLLFFGPSGSGKTSTINCCIKEIYGKYKTCMILELNASNERGIETVRTKIKNFVGGRSSIFLPEKMRGLFKFVILDEIDSMTVEAQGMLRQTIEKNSATTRFCLICNDIDKINQALQSRCALFRFTPLDTESMKIRLTEICEQESIDYKPNVINTIVNISKGDMRAAINTLQHVTQAINGRLTSSAIYRITGNCHPKIIQSIFDKFYKLYTQESSLVDCVERIYEIVQLHNITMFNLLGELKNIILSSLMSTDQIIFLIDNLAQQEIYDSVNVDPKIVIMTVASDFILVRSIAT